MRDRLVELIAEGRELCEQIPCEGCTRSCKGLNDCLAKVQADHLLANGAIVPPCKVGDTVYYIHHSGSRVFEGEVTSYVYVSDSKSFGIHHDGGYGVYGRYVFLTREEAEQAMKEQGNGGQ